MSQRLLARPGFTFGCDPEGFIFDPEGNPVPASDFIPGTKESPHPVEFGAIQVDGMAAEFNIDPVCTFEDFDRNIRRVIEQLRGYLPKGHSLQFVPTVTFDKDVFNRTPDEHKVLGCTPDFNAWTGEVNPPPNTASDPFRRCGGGHLHIGWRDDGDPADIQHVVNCQDLVKQLDWYLAGWSLSVDKDTTRRSLYGKAGACRYKPYGVEYRTLSNFWVDKTALRALVWDRLQAAIHDMRTRYHPDKAGSGYSSLLIESINTSKMHHHVAKAFAYPIKTTDVSESNY